MGDPGGDAEHGRRDASAPGRDRQPPAAPEPPAAADDRGNVQRRAFVTGMAVAGARPECPAQGVGV